jgi:hypothetical protein
MSLNLWNLNNKDGSSHIHRLHKTFQDYQKILVSHRVFPKYQTTQRNTRRLAGNSRLPGNPKAVPS